MATGLFYHDAFQAHDTGAHPECADRLRAMLAQFQADGLWERCVRPSFGPVPILDLLKVHSPDQVTLVDAACAAGGGRIEVDTVVSPASFGAARLAVGAARAAVDAVLSHELANAFCMVRPPGHHATPMEVMGFCLFNTVALAADHARRKHGLERVLIVDFDVHHGNGTQDCLERGGAHFFSVHRYGGGFYPGTGAERERGVGNIRNLPLPAHTPREQFLERFRRATEEFIIEAQPHLLILSSGFDAHRLDPVGGLGLESEDYGLITDHLLALAQHHCGGRVVSCLEGGYHWQATAESAALHVERLLAAGAA